jgi:hypothetical protein
LNRPGELSQGEHRPTCYPRFFGKTRYLVEIRGFFHRYLPLSQICDRKSTAPLRQNRKNVIIPMAVLWTIRCYVSSDGTDQIRAWYNAQPRKVQGKFLSRLRTLAQLDLKEWQLPLFRFLHGDCVPLGEMRFKVQNVQHRPLGYRAGERVFTLTFCAIEKSNRFVPPNACQRALERKGEIERDGSRSNVCWLPLE